MVVHFNLSVRHTINLILSLELPVSQCLYQISKTRESQGANKTVQNLQQFAYKPVQERVESSVGNRTEKQQPAAVVAPHPRGNGWENIDLCQQRSLGTLEWNIQPPRGISFVH